MQERTVRTVVVKRNLGGEERKRRRKSRDTADKRGRRITIDRGHRS